MSVNKNIMRETLVLFFVLVLAIAIGLSDGWRRKNDRPMGLRRRFINEEDSDEDFDSGEYQSRNPGHRNRHRKGNKGKDKTEPGFRRRVVNDDGDNDDSDEDFTELARSYVDDSYPRKRHNKRGKRRKGKAEPGFRRRVVNDEEQDDDSIEDVQDIASRFFEQRARDRAFRRHFTPWRSRFRFGLFGNRGNWFDLNFGFELKKPWHQGPNVCSHRNVIKNETDGSEISSHSQIKTQFCDDKGTSYKCTDSIIARGKEQTIVTIKECCQGFTRHENQYGCPEACEELKTQNLIETAEELKLNKFLEAVNLAGLEEELRIGNITLFAPVDDAYEDLSQALAPKYQSSQNSDVLMVSQPLMDTVVADLKAILLGHVVPHIYTSNRLSDEQLIETESPHKGKLRINFYDSGLMTANCIKVTSRDNVATNGVIHVVEKTIQPTTKSLMDIISTDQEMSLLKTAIGKSGLRKRLLDEGQLTLFAPTDTAFRKLEPALLSRILEGDQECIIKLLQNHILPHVICSEAIKGRAKSKNLLNHMLNLTKDSDDKLFVNGAQAVRKDMMSSNGVMYVIDEVLVPDEALDVLQIAKKSGAATMAKLIETTGLAKTLQSLQNLTLFIPSDEAMKNIEQLPTDPAELMEVLTYHVVPSELETCHMWNNDMLDTLNGKKLRFQEYARALLVLDAPNYWKWSQDVQCAALKKPNIRACNGVIHVIDKVLMPQSRKILDVIAQDSRFSELAELIKIAEIGDALNEDGPFTVFAPTNEAFRSLDNEVLQKIVNNKEKLKELLLNHVFKGQLCCSKLEILSATLLFGERRLKMLSGAAYPVSHDSSTLKIGQSEISECDVITSNGVIHAADKVLMKRSHFYHIRWG